MDSCRVLSVLCALQKGRFETRHTHTTHAPGQKTTPRTLYTCLYIYIIFFFFSLRELQAHLSPGRNTCACSQPPAHNSCISMRLHTRAICQRMPKLEHFDTLIRGKAGHRVCCWVQTAFFFFPKLLLFILSHTGVVFFFFSAGCGGGDIQWLSRTSAASQQGQMAFYNWCNPSPGDSGGED